MGMRLAAPGLRHERVCAYAVGVDWSDAVRWSGVSVSTGQRRQAGESHQVVGGGHQIAGKVDPLQSAVARLAQATDRFHPAEDFFDTFAHFLTGTIARSAGRASIHGTAAASGVL